MQLAKERDLQAARLQLGRLESERQEALEQYKVRSRMEFYTYLRTGRDFINKSTESLEIVPRKQKILILYYQLKTHSCVW